MAVHMGKKHFAERHYEVNLSPYQRMMDLHNIMNLHERTLLSADYIFKLNFCVQLQKAIASQSYLIKLPLTTFD